MDCKHLIIGAQDSILSALKQMDSINKKLLVVYSENKSNLSKIVYIMI